MEYVPSSVTNNAQRRGARSTIDLLDIFWRRRIYIVCCVLLGITVGVIYCETATILYESSADVLVVQKHHEAVTGDKQFESGFEDYLATHLAVIVSPLIVERAIDAYDLGSFDSFADVENPEEDLADTIIGQLEVEGGSRILGESADSIMTLSFRGSVAEECPKVVQAVLDSYEELHHEVYQGMSDNTVVLIDEARKLLEKDLKAQEENYSLFRQKSPLVARGTDEVNPLQDRLASIEEQRSEILLRRAEIERQLLALEQASQDGTDYQQLLAIVSELRQLATAENGLPNLSVALESQLLQLVDEQQRLSELYGPNHPHSQMIRERIAATRRFFALPTSAHMQQPNNGGEAESTLASADPVAVYTNYLGQELKRLQISEKLLTDLYQREHSAAKEHSIFQLQDDRLQRGIERTEALYEVVINRLQEASLVKDFGGFETKVIAPPKLGTKVSPSRRVTLPAAAFVGMMLGCMLALVVELRDDCFHSSEDVQRQLGLSVVGRIPQFDAASVFSRSTEANVDLDRMLCCYHVPQSLASESFRALRTALCAGSLKGKSRVIQVTSPGLRDGASTVVANLAICLAQAGKRVLLIDGDLNQPRQHKMFGMSGSEQGLAAIVSSTDVEPDDVIRQTEVNNLWLLPVGQLPAGPRELFTAPRFGELMNLVRDSYDHILIDTAPLSVASDPCVIATYTDGVLLALRLTGDSRRRAQQAREMLDQVDVKICGVVINQMNRSMLKQHLLNPNYHASPRRSGATQRSPTNQPVRTAD